MEGFIEESCMSDTQEVSQKRVYSQEVLQAQTVTVPCGSGGNDKAVYSELSSLWNTHCAISCKSSPDSTGEELYLTLVAATLEAFPESMRASLTLPECPLKSPGVLQPHGSPAISSDQIPPASARLALTVPAP